MKPKEVRIHCSGVTCFCEERKRPTQGKIVEGVLYREVPGLAWYLAGEDGSVWRGRLEEEKSKWFRPKLHRNNRSTTWCLWVSGESINGFSGIQSMRRAGELILLAYWGKPTATEKFFDYKDGNPDNLRPDNLTWSERKRGRKRKQAKYKAKRVEKGKRPIYASLG